VLVNCQERFGKHAGLEELFATTRRLKSEQSSCAG
jgi:hypothetical protein